MTTFEHFKVKKRLDFFIETNQLTWFNPIHTQSFWINVSKRIICGSFKITFHFDRGWGLSVATREQKIYLWIESGQIIWPTQFKDKIFSENFCFSWCQKLFWNSPSQDLTKHSKKLVGCGEGQGFWKINSRLNSHPLSFE